VPHSHRRYEGSIGTDESLILDDRAVFVCSIVVANNGTGANVYAAADGSVPEVSEVVCLGTLTQNTVFCFHEVADASIFRKHRTGTHSGIRTDLAMPSYTCAIQVAERCNDGAGANLGILDYAVRPNGGPLEESDVTLENAAGVDDDVGRTAKLAAHVQPRWVGEGDTRCHERARDIQLIVPLELCELFAAVDPLDFPGIRSVLSDDFHSAGQGKWNDVGQIVLTLGIMALELAQPIA